MHSHELLLVVRADVCTCSLGALPYVIAPVKVVNETYDAETETRPRHWSDGLGLVRRDRDETFKTTSRDVRSRRSSRD